MMVFLWLICGTPLQKVELQTYFLRPMVSWGDVNHDGVIDFWVEEIHDDLPDTNNIWFHDGRWAGQKFEKKAYPSVPGKVVPTGVAGEICLTTYDEGLELVLHGQQWQVAHDYADLGQIRPGINPFSLGDQKLIPTYSGYTLMDDRCLIADFKAKPALTVKKTKFELTWPIPQLKDLDGDGALDLIGAPVRSPQNNEAWVWFALRRGDRWHEQTAKLSFPSNLTIVGYQFGDLDGDAHPELVIMTQEDQEFSLFDELGFVVYSGITDGGWEPVALQTLKTDQNIWQTGPIELDSAGITFYYYKGLINSRFRMDRYRWDEKGFVKPNPDSRTWKLKEGDRDFIDMSYDLNGDGFKDLLLQGEKGVLVFFRKPKGAFPFEETPDRILTPAGITPAEVSLSLGKKSLIKGNVDKNRLGTLQGNGYTLVQSLDGLTPTLWSLKKLPSGFIAIEEFDLKTALKPL